MAFIEVKLFDHRVTDEPVPRIIEALTDAIVESSGAKRENVQIVLQGIPPKHWGSAGKPCA